MQSSAFVTGLFPKDVNFEIFKFLSTPQLIKLSEVSKTMKRAVEAYFLKRIEKPETVTYKDVLVYARLKNNLNIVPEYFNQHYSRFTPEQIFTWTDQVEDVSKINLTALVDALCARINDLDLSLGRFLIIIYASQFSKMRELSEEECKKDLLNFYGLVSKLETKSLEGEKEGETDSKILISLPPLKTDFKKDNYSQFFFQLLLSLISTYTSSDKPLPILNLAGLNFSECNFEGIELRRINFKNANLSRANLSHSKLLHCILDAVTLTDATISNSTGSNVLANSKIINTKFPIGWAAVLMEFHFPKGIMDDKNKFQKALEQFRGQMEENALRNLAVRRSLLAHFNLIIEEILKRTNNSIQFLNDVLELVEGIEMLIVINYDVHFFSCDARLIGEPALNIFYERQEELMAQRDVLSNEVDESKSFGNK